jgi:hypothetical protein
MAAGATHIDHVDLLRAGATGGVLGHAVMAPSTLGTFLRGFTFGHLRQLDRVLAEVLRRAWSLVMLPDRLVVDLYCSHLSIEGLRPRRRCFPRWLFRPSSVRHEDPSSHADDWRRWP